MSELVLSGAAVYTEDGVFNDMQIVIRDGSIEAIEKRSSLSREGLHFPAHHIVPGFIDLHVHGACHHDVMDASEKALTAISRALAAEGTTSFLATTMTAAPVALDRVFKTIRHGMERSLEFSDGARLLGVHLEGPFISPKKAGAQCADKALLPDIDLIKHWQLLSAGAIKLVTLAPELPHCLDLIHYLNQTGIVPAMGHTHATYAEANRAIDAGCHYATHLFNAMSGIHHREPGAVTAALLSDKVMTELIADGHHVHPAVLQMVVRLKGIQNLILVTDAMRAQCLGDGVYDLGGQSVTVTQGVPRLANGALAGSVLTLPGAIKNMLQWTGDRLETIIKMATENPAKVLGLFAKKGSIAVNKDADLVVLTDQFEVVLTVVGGKIVYQKNLNEDEKNRSRNTTKKITKLV